MKLLSDNPITAISDDMFGFSPFVRILGEAIVDTQSLPFTVGIFGEWGTGKTSLLRLLQEWVIDRGCKTVWFNPWKYDNKEKLWAALIQTILLEIEKEKELSAALKDLALQMLKDTAWTAFKFGVSTMTHGILSGEELEAMKTNLEKQSKSEHEFLDKFESNFQKLVNGLVGNAGRLIVFVDDLDRCVPENAITVLESLKLYLDRSQCVFVIGMDRTIVEMGIIQRYGEKLELSGREYLEKIVQLPFFLPPVQFEKLKSALTLRSEAADLGPQMWTLLRYGLGGNPRKVKRFVNSFYLAKEALQIRDVLEDFMPADTEIEDYSAMPEEYKLFYLAKILVLQMAFPDFYEYLLVNPGGWELYEKALRGAPAFDRERVLREDPDFAKYWTKRQLYFFMANTYGEGFPPTPSPITLEPILRLTSIVERSSGVQPAT